MAERLQIPSGTPENYVPTPDTGLTTDEVTTRQRDGLSNKVKADSGKSVWQILMSNFFTLFNLLNFALAACLLLVGSYRNMLFLGVVFSNTLIGTIQELRAKRTIEKLQLLNAPQAHAIRNGEEVTCTPDELVQDDLVVLRAGDQVLADAIVRSGGGAANESLLTGESDAIGKHAGDWLMSGSYITEGKFVAQLVHVGSASYAAELTREAKAIKRPNSVLMTELNRLVRRISVILVPMGLLLFCKQYFLNHAALTAAIPSTVAAMIGMIPEGLILLTSVALAVGVVKLGRHQTLVQELYGIETLARVDVLCLDKTGTITKGEMQLEKLIPVDGDEGTLRSSLARFLGAFETSNGTLKAMADAVKPESVSPIGILPFSSKRKKSAVSFPEGDTLILGAPSFVLEDHFPDDLRQTIDAYTADGYRVLVLARAEGCVTEEDAPPVTQVLGLICLSDALRENAADTLAYFRQQGVTIKVISGDDPRTVSSIAKRVQLEGWDRWVDATTLTTESQLRDAAEKYTVFGRVTPMQKKQLVEALKSLGHSVAMTGDGVNDIPALKTADCSIAMAGGADAAKHAAQLTLLNADFASLPLVVDEGRRVINNITRAASLFLVKTLYSFALSVITLLFPLNYPFQPIQLTLISSVTIGIPTFFLALEPNRERVQGKFLETVMRNAIPGAAGVTLCAIAAMVMAHFGHNATAVSTMATIAAGTVGLMVLTSVCLPFTLMWGILLGVMTLGFAGAVLFAGKTFLIDVFALTPRAWLVLTTVQVASALVMVLLRKELNRHLEKKRLKQA